MYNECLMRSKYAYDYAVLFDVDEFIYINTTTMGRKGPVPLPQFLRATFPSKVCPCTTCTERGAPHYTNYCRRHSLLLE